jgi:hypothetical protein
MSRCFVFLFNILVNISIFNISLHYLISLKFNCKNAGKIPRPEAFAKGLRKNFVKSSNLKADEESGYQYLQCINTFFPISSISSIVFVDHSVDSRYRYFVSRYSDVGGRLKWDSCRTRFYRHYGEHNFSYIRGSKAASYFWCRAWRWLKRASERVEERENESEICIQFQPGLFCFTRFLRIHYAGRARLLKQSFILSMRLYRPQKGARFPACDTRVRVIHLRLVAGDTRRAEIRVRWCKGRGVNDGECERCRGKDGGIIKMYVWRNGRTRATERNSRMDFNAPQSLIILMCR